MGSPIVEMTIGPWEESSSGGNRQQTTFQSQKSVKGGGKRSLTMRNTGSSTSGKGILGTDGDTGVTSGNNMRDTTSQADAATMLTIPMTESTKEPAVGTEKREERTKDAKTERSITSGSVHTEDSAGVRTIRSASDRTSRESSAGTLRSNDKTSDLKNSVTKTIYSMKPSSNTATFGNPKKYKAIGCHSSLASLRPLDGKACAFLNGKGSNKNMFIRKCAFCADMVVRTPIFAVDADEGCYAAKELTCNVGANRKLSNKMCVAGEDDRLTTYVVGQKYVDMVNYDIEIRSSIFWECAGPGEVPEVPLPKSLRPAITTNDATSLLQLTVNEAPMSTYSRQEATEIKNFLTELANKTIFTSDTNETTIFLDEFVKATYRLLSSKYFAESSEGSAVAASEVQYVLESCIKKASESLQSEVVILIKHGSIDVELSGELASKAKKEGVSLPQFKWPMKNGDCLIPASYFKNSKERNEPVQPGEEAVDEPNYISFVAVAITKETLNLPLQLEEGTSNDTNVSMITDVVTFSTSAKRPKNIQQPVVLTLLHSEPVPNITKAASFQVETECVFWDYSLSPQTGGAWSTRGCKMHSTNQTHTVCQCDHMTSFAVLMKFRPYHSPVIIQLSYVVLDIVTYVGVSVSILSLLATFGIFIYLKDSLHSERTTIHKNLMVAIGLGQLIFISGINVTQDKITCTAIAVLLHFFFLASFMWMLAEGLHLYAKVVWVFSGGKNMLPLYYTLGWAVPSIIIIISSGIRIDGYGNEEYCWLSVEDGIIWAFIGPALTVIAINLLILILVVRIVVLSAGSIPQTKDPKFTTQAWCAIKGIVILTPILGVSWLFGFLAINRHLLVFEFIFTFLNAFQGLFIFLFHCVGNSEVRAAFKRKREQSSLSKELQSVRISTPLTSKSSKLRIPVIVMSDYEKGKLGSSGSLSSVCSGAKVAPCEQIGYPKKVSMPHSTTSIQTVDAATNPKNIKITIQQQPHTEIEEDFESFDSIGVSSVSSGASLPIRVGHGKESGNIIEVENPSHYIINKSKNAHLRCIPFASKPVLFRRKQTERF